MNAADRGVFSGVMALAAGLMLVIGPVHADIADGEREYVQKLVHRGWFDLAAQFCESRLDELPDVNDRADWESLLSECRQQHAWFMDEDSRYGLIGQSAQRITEFLEANTPSAEQDILLRVRHLELLAAAGIMEVIVQTPISGRLSVRRGSTAPSRTRARRTTSSMKFALTAAAEGTKAAEALLKQIDEIQRDVDSDVVRFSKERIRLSLAEMTLVRSRLGPVADSAPLAVQAIQQIEQLQKSAAEDFTRFRCRVLLAEQQLEQNDAAAFRLRLGSVSSSARNEDERAQAAALKIRLLLNEGQPTEALQEYVQASQAGLTLNQELQTLRLQSLLQLLEVVSQLDMSQHRDALLKSTAEEFTALRGSTVLLTSGVWRQRCLRISQHFDRVLQVGAEAAQDLEEVAVLVEQGKISAGREILKSVVLRLSESDKMLAARVLLQSGSLSVRLGEWSDATKELQTATQFFLEAKDETGAAGADLLKVYAIGQNWSEVPASGISEQDYRDAIEKHIEQFPAQSTALQAREWRALLQQQSDPLGSARELLLLAESDRSLAQEDTDSALQRRISRVCLAGDLLVEAMSRQTALHTDVSSTEGDQRSNAASNPPGSSDKWPLESVSNSFDREISELEANADAGSDSWIRWQNIMQAQQLGLQLQRPLSIQADWQGMNKSARRLRLALSQSSQELRSAPQDAAAAQGQSGTRGETNKGPSRTVASSTAAAGWNARAEMVCDACLILSGVRQLEDSGTWEEARRSLSRQPFDHRFRIIRILSKQLGSPGKVIPGDGQLAHILIALSESSDVDGQMGETVETRIRRLELLQPLCVAAGSSAALERVIGELAGMELTESQMLETAAVLSQYSVNSSGRVLPAAGRFWQALQKRSRPGQEAWLEASLQIAMMAEKEGKRDEVLRILGVVSVLYPEWGSPARKARAELLLQRSGASP